MCVYKHQVVLSLKIYGQTLSSSLPSTVAIFVVKDKHLSGRTEKKSERRDKTNTFRQKAKDLQINGFNHFELDYSTVYKLNVTFTAV